MCCRPGRARLAVLAPVVMIATGATAACGEVGCTETSLEARPATFRDDGALVFEAELTADGDPVAEAPIAFFSLTEGDQGPGGRIIGTVDTTDDGVATLVRGQGLTDMAVLDNEVVGYQASFRRVGEIGDTVYCSSERDGEIEDPPTPG